MRKLIYKNVTVGGVKVSGTLNRDKDKKLILTTNKGENIDVIKLQNKKKSEVKKAKEITLGKEAVAEEELKEKIVQNELKKNKNKQKAIEEAKKKILAYEVMKFENQYPTEKLILNKTKTQVAGVQSGALGMSMDIDAYNKEVERINQQNREYEKKIDEQISKKAGMSITAENYSKIEQQPKVLNSRVAYEEDGIYRNNSYLDRTANRVLGNNRVYQVWEKQDRGKERILNKYNEGAEKYFIEPIQKDWKKYSKGYKPEYGSKAGYIAKGLTTGFGYTGLYTAKVVLVDVPVGTYMLIRHPFKSGKYILEYASENEPRDALNQIIKSTKEDPIKSAATITGFTILGTGKKGKLEVPENTVVKTKTGEIPIKDLAKNKTPLEKTFTKENTITLKDKRVNIPENVNKLTKEQLLKGEKYKQNWEINKFRVADKIDRAKIKLNEAKLEVKKIPKRIDEIGKKTRENIRKAKEKAKENKNRYRQWIFEDEIMSQQAYLNNLEKLRHIPYNVKLELMTNVRLARIKYIEAKYNIKGLRNILDDLKGKRVLKNQRLADELYRNIEYTKRSQKRKGKEIERFWKEYKQEVMEGRINRKQAYFNLKDKLRVYSRRLKQTPKNTRDWISSNIAMTKLKLIDLKYSLKDARNNYKRNAIEDEIWRNQNYLNMMEKVKQGSRRGARNIREGIGTNYRLGKLKYIDYKYNIKEMPKIIKENIKSRREDFRIKRRIGREDKNLNWKDGMEVTIEKPKIREKQVKQEPKPLEWSIDPEYVKKIQKKINKAKKKGDIVYEVMPYEKYGKPKANSQGKMKYEEYKPEITETKTSQVLEKLENVKPEQVKVYEIVDPVKVESMKKALLKEIERRKNKLELMQKESERLLNEGLARQRQQPKIKNTLIEEEVQLVKPKKRTQPEMVQIKERIRQGEKLKLRLVSGQLDGAIEKVADEIAQEQYQKYNMGQPQISGLTTRQAISIAQSQAIEEKQRSYTSTSNMIKKTGKESKRFRGKQSKKLVMAYIPVLTDNKGNVIYGDKFATKKEAISEGMIATDETPAVEFSLVTELVPRNEIKRGRPNKVGSKFMLRGDRYVEKGIYQKRLARPESKSWKSFNISPYVWGR